MKTIFSYISKCLLVYTISFALLQVQVLLPIQNLKHSTGYVQADELTDSTTGTDDDGVLYTKGQTEMDSAETGLAMDVLAMFAFGYITSRALVVCKPIPADVMVATAGGVAYMVGEIMAFNAFDDIEDAETQKYKIREDGDNTDTVEILTSQKKMYDEIAKAAKTKEMLQLAAAAAYGAATATALITWLVGESTLTGCKLCVGGSTALAATFDVQSKIVGAPSVTKYATLQANCIALVDGEKADTLGWLSACTTATTAWEAAVTAAAVPGAGLAATALVTTTLASMNTTCGEAAVCTTAIASCEGFRAYCVSELAMCIPVAVVNNDLGNEKKINLFAKFMKEKVKLPDNDTQYGIEDNDIRQALQEIEIEKVAEHFNISSFLRKSSPFYNLNVNKEIVGENLDEKVNSYITHRDMIRFYDGGLHTATLDEYSDLRETFYHLMPNSQSEDITKTLQVALDYGLDLLVPRVNAGSSITAMISGVVGIVVAIIAGSWAALDTFMVDPSTRAIAWGAGAALALVGMNQTKSVREAAEGNSEKLQAIIDRLNKVKSLNTESLSGTNTSIPTRIPYPITGNNGIVIDEENVPCAEKDASSGCQQLVPQFKNSHGFANLDTTTAGFALDALKNADNMTGNNNMSGAAVDQAVGLGNNNNAIQKRVRALQRKMNKDLRSKGQNAINFDKLNSKLIAKIKKKIGRSLRKSGQSANQILASLGNGSKGEGKKEEVAKGPSKVKGTTGGKRVVAKKAPVFSLDLDDTEEDSGLTAGDVSSNQDAANALNGESTDDIVTNKSVSIFKVISVRYLKSGFSRLLDEEKRATK